MAFLLLPTWHNITVNTWPRFTFGICPSLTVASLTEDTLFWLAADIWLNLTVDPEASLTGNTWFWLAVDIWLNLTVDTQISITVFTPLTMNRWSCITHDT
jgi:hypothetical protein